MSALEVSFERRMPEGNVLWTVTEPVEKLALRAKLPGASSFDQAGFALASAHAAGAPLIDLVALALPASWLVNSATPSTVFKKWLARSSREHWETLLADPRDEGALEALAIAGQGAGAISKVLALLLPSRVPLMPDAAIAFALGALPAPDPKALDAQTAKVTLFVPMIDWFGAAVGANESALSAIGEADAKSRAAAWPLSAAQVLDRLVWFESAGFHHFTQK